MNDFCTIFHGILNCNCEWSPVKFGSVMPAFHPLLTVNCAFRLPWIVYRVESRAERIVSYEPNICFQAFQYLHFQSLVCFSMEFH